MNQQSVRFLDFGSFSLDLKDRILLLHGRPTKLAAGDVDVLEYLILHRDHIVSKKELKDEVWLGSSVEDNTVERRIANIRKVLKDGPPGEAEIVTYHKRGWSFVADVRERPDSPATIPEVDATPPASLPRDSRRVWLLAGVIAVLMLSAYEILWVTSVSKNQESRVLRFFQLTSDGRPKDGPLIIDGQDILFHETFGTRRMIVRVSTRGDNPTPVELPLSFPILNDVSPDGKTLLVLTVGYPMQMWICPLSGGKPRVLFSGVRYASFSPEGHSVVVAGGNLIHLLDLQRGTPSLSRQFPGDVIGPRWTPDGKRISFFLYARRNFATSLWEFDPHSGEARQLSGFPGEDGSVNPGLWSRDDKFFFDFGRFEHRDIWLFQAVGGFLDFSTKGPIPVTRGPGSWSWPTPSTKPGTIFALGAQSRSELARFDTKTSSWGPEWGGASDYELDFSRDGNWVVYTHYPDHSLWKRRADGSQPTRLTLATLEAHQPHWSPDGRQIAFMGIKPSGVARVFLVDSAGGGPPRELIPIGPDQGSPTWSSDGRFLVFGDWPNHKPGPSMSLHLFDIKTHRSSELGVRGVWTSRWAPNGKSISALSFDSRALGVLSWPGLQWKELVRMAYIDNASWSSDSEYLYFFGKRQMERPQYFRIRASDGTIKTLVDLTGFPQAPENWDGAKPDGTPLAFRQTSATEVFSLECQLP